MTPSPTRDPLHAALAREARLREAGKALLEAIDKHAVGGSLGDPQDALHDALSDPSHLSHAAAEVLAAAVAEADAIDAAERVETYEEWEEAIDRVAAFERKRESATARYRAILRDLLWNEIIHCRALLREVQEGEGE